MNLITITANEDGDNQRTTSQTQFYRYWHAGNGDRQRTKDKSQEDTHENGGDVRRIQFVAGITHTNCYTVNSILWTYDSDLITHLKGQIW